MTIRQLQDYLKAKDHRPAKKPDYILKFMEESGELAKAILNNYPHAQGDEIKNTIEEEFCDVLYYLCALANLYDVDIEKWFPVKARKADEKYSPGFFDAHFPAQPQEAFPQND